MLWTKLKPSIPAAQQLLQTTFLSLQRHRWAQAQLASGHGAPGFTHTNLVPLSGALRLLAGLPAASGLGCVGLGGWLGAQHVMIRHPLAPPAYSLLFFVLLCAQVIAMVDSTTVSSSLQESLASSQEQVFELQKQLAEAHTVKKAVDKELGRLQKQLTDDQAERTALEKQLTLHFEDTADYTAQVRILTGSCKAKVLLRAADGTGSTVM